MSEQIRLLLADDHPLLRRGLRAMLIAADDISVIGEATNGDDAVTMVVSLQPDLVLMDLQMPGKSGIEATREILAEAPAIAILMLTLFDDDDSVFAALRAGARGYVLKDSDEQELLRAIRSVAAGQAMFSAGVASRVLTYFAVPSRSARELFPALTDREREILELMAQGRNNAAIAAALFIAPKTVANHVSNIYAKLQVADRAEAIIRAREAGLR